MQTIQIEVKDDYLANVLKLLESVKGMMIEKIEVQDEMLKIDPYFYERKAQLAKVLEEIENGKMEVYDFDEFEKEMDEFEKELAVKYGG